MRRAILVLATTLAATTGAQAQSGPPQRNHALAFNPIAILFESMQLEYEGRVHAEATVGGGFEYFQSGEEEDSTQASQTSFDVKGRFYPDNAFEGFSFGASVGFSRITYVDDESLAEESASGPTFGIEVGHSWLLGDAHRWYLGLGLGAKRYFISEEDDDIPGVTGTGRLVFGFAF